MKCYIRTASSVMVRRSLFQQTGLFRTDLLAADHDMWIRMGEKQIFILYRSILHLIGSGKGKSVREGNCGRMGLLYFKRLVKDTRMGFLSKEKEGQCYIIGLERMIGNIMIIFELYSIFLCLGF